MFYQRVSTSKELRDASSQAEILLRDFEVESEMRMDVFIAKKNAAANIKETITPEQQRLVDRMLLEGKRAGLELPEEEGKLLTEKKKELSQLCVEFGVCHHFLSTIIILQCSHSSTRQKNYNEESVCTRQYISDIHV